MSLWRETKSQLNTAASFTNDPLGNASQILRNRIMLIGFVFCLIPIPLGAPDASIAIFAGGCVFSLPILYAVTNPIGARYVIITLCILASLIVVAAVLIAFVEKPMAEGQIAMTVLFPLAYFGYVGWVSARQISELKGI